MELENIILSEVILAQKAKSTCSPLYVDYRPKTNAVTLLDMGHTLRGKHTCKKQGKERVPNLNVADMLTGVNKVILNCQRLLWDGD
jgi:hypothetical protein